MASSFSRHLDVEHILAAFVALCGWGGLLGIFMVVVVGFEEPDNRLLLGSCMLLAAAPITVLVHLWRTRKLTRAQKRLWFRELTGWNAPRAFSAYLARSGRHR